MADVDFKNGKIIVKSTNEDIVEMMQYARASWNGSKEQWIAFNNPRLLFRLHRKGYTLSYAAREAYRAYKRLDVPEHLYSFQDIGVRTMEYYGGVLLLADDMGIGKTIQLLTWISVTKKIPAVIVVPAYLRLNWARETVKWTSLTYQVIQTGKDVLDMVDVYIISYNLLETFKQQFLRRKVQVVAADEAHYLKTPTVTRSKAFKAVSRRTPHRVLMTGTPITSRTYELWNLLNILNPRVWKNRRGFGNRYCDPRSNGFGVEFNGNSNTKELRRKMKLTGFLRRTKDEVLTELPDKVREVIPVEISNRKEYRKAEKDIINYFQNKGDKERADNASRAAHITQLTELKKLAGMGKLKAVEGWLKDKVEDGLSIIVFGIHKEVLKTLHAKFPKDSAIIIGDTSQKKRQQAQDDFQAGKIPLIFGNVDSMGTGLTLTKSSTVVFVEYPWEPAKVDQAEDRAHRIGQEDLVTVHYMVGFGTIDEKMVNMIDAKRLIFREAIDGVENITEKDSIVSQLVREYGGS